MENSSGKESADQSQALLQLGDPCLEVQALVVVALGIQVEFLLPAANLAHFGVDLVVAALSYPEAKIANEPFFRNAF